MCSSGHDIFAVWGLPSTAWPSCCTCGGGPRETPKTGGHEKGPLTVRQAGLKIRGAFACESVAYLRARVVARSARLRDHRHDSEFRDSHECLLLHTWGSGDLCPTPSSIDAVGGGVNGKSAGILEFRAKLGQSPQKDLHGCGRRGRSMGQVHTPGPEDLGGGILPRRSRFPQRVGNRRIGRGTGRKSRTPWPRS